MRRRRNRLVIVEDPRRGVVALKGWRAKQLLVDAGIKPYWSVVAGGWIVDSGRVPDLCAWIEYNGIPYRFEQRADDG